MPAQRYELSPVWRIAIKELQLPADNVLRRARLPDDLFESKGARVNAEEFFGLFESIHEMSGDPLLNLKFAQLLNAGQFDPLLYAAFCSPDLNRAAHRVALFKRLLAPIILRVDVGERRTVLRFTPRDPSVIIPPSYAAADLVWWTALLRKATGEPVSPTKVTLPAKQDDAFMEFFGAKIGVAPKIELEFAAEDATLPFLAANDEIWTHLEPSFRRRMTDLDGDGETTERIRLALLEMLPGGQTTLREVGARLGVGARTLQRKLTQEGTSFQECLNETRKELALHYLRNSTVSCAEISFLLGFADPNSFFRAFHGWTGDTPEATRARLRGGAICMCIDTIC